MPDAGVPSAEPETLLEASGLSVHFPLRREGLFGRRPVLKAVESVDLALCRGETLALLGESGCGKTTLARALVLLHRRAAGEIAFRGRALSGADRAQVRAFRRAVQMLFQDPFGSLDPRMTVGRIIAEPLAIHGLGTRTARRQKVAELLEAVGLRGADAGRYAHEFSGGQRQRIALARALSVNPEVVIADEPVSALDVSIQSQILNLLADLKERLGLSLLFIGHDIAAVDFLADRVAVMYLGRIVETGPRSRVLGAPAHPYTRALITAAPRLGREAAHRSGEKPGLGETRGAGGRAAAEVPSALVPPSGCPFHPRCPYARAVCAEVRPELLPVEPGAIPHEAACHFADEVLR